MNIFVYGTLKRGFRLHEAMGDALFLGEDAVRGRLYSLGAFPGLKQGRDVVKGELYDVDPYLIKRLDNIEGHPTFYRRTELTLESGKKALVYVYQGEVSKKNYIPKGVWEK